MTNICTFIFILLLCFQFRAQNDSVLENHHWRSAMACLIESGLMDGLDCKSANELQQQIQSLILATDIARQAEFLSNFQVQYLHFTIVFIF